MRGNVVAVFAKKERGLIVGHNDANTELSMYDGELIKAHTSLD